MKPTMVAGGSVGGALGYLTAAVPTVWLGWLPVIPEPHFMPIVVALGAVFSALLMLVFGFNGKSKEPKE